MGRYSSLVGKRVEAHYRAGEILLSAAGTLVADTEKSIFLEERFSQRGREKTMRVEIPHECVIRISEAPGEPANPAYIAIPSPKKHS
jgi:hypothetical protein